MLDSCLFYTAIYILTKKKKKNQPYYFTTCTSVAWKETIPILGQYVSGYFRELGCCKLVVWQYDVGVMNWMPKRLS